MVELDSLLHTVIGRTPDWQWQYVGYLDIVSSKYKRQVVMSTVYDMRWDHVVDVEIWKEYDESSGVWHVDYSKTFNGNMVASVGFIENWIVKHLNLSLCRSVVES